ncbi:MAG: hypothetical protein KME11_05560 [Timaviella obliquedivisa GSE-PSE-MK23-08B]|jgi:hypothetical protein|nr:hypothetical protein [Timaviella obliquedivisa GSE-PSE-MK23-08B]
MSEYQHYEFQALDRPLTKDELSYVRSLSSRVELTSNKATFVYSFGDFKIDPQQLVERCFDAMLYQASFGIQQVIFRFPRALLNPLLFAPYCVPHSLTISTTSEHILLNLKITEEEGLGWIREEDWLTKLVPLRDDLLRGDLRMLYLAWLIAIQVDSEEDEDFIEPPVPPNLGNLSSALSSFVDLFGLDEDLLSAAAENSPFEEEESEPIETWVAALPEAERNSFLIRLARGESHVASQLIQRLRQVNQLTRSIAPSDQPRRSLADLMAIALTQEKNRKTREQQIARQARMAQLEVLAPKENLMWQEVFRLIELKQTKAYDQAIEYLIDLRDLAEQQETLPQFVARIKKIRDDYSHRSALMLRLQQAGY